MGGWGSGRPETRGKVECYPRLDVNRLRAAGFLTPGQRRVWRWTTENGVAASAESRMGPEGLRFIYRERGGAPETLEHLLKISMIPCNYGGTRPYFVCAGMGNGRPCGRRVVHLYGMGRLACRQCHGLAYASQSEDDLTRRQRKVLKLEGRLDSADDSSVRRPRGMWRRTYEHLEAEWQAAEDRAEEAFIRKILHLV